MEIFCIKSPVEYPKFRPGRRITITKLGVRKNLRGRNAGDYRGNVVRVVVEGELVYSWKTGDSLY